jgi:hypothetical protein
MTRIGVFACVFVLAATAARAEVHFGNHVYIGGHNVSHQTFNRQRRGEYYLYGHKPRPEGCAWRRNGDGSQTKVCRFQTLH